MNWFIEDVDVCYVVGNQGLGVIQFFFSNKVLYCLDIKVLLVVVFKCFQVVQLGEILEFYCDLIEVGGFELEIVGVLCEGCKFWVLVCIGQSVMLCGKDKVEGYLLFVMVCDGMLVIMVQFISVWVVCNNMLQIVLGYG